MSTTSAISRSTTPAFDRFSAPLPGFEHIRGTWEAGPNTYAAKILPGEYYVTVQDEVIITVLGSCVSACIRDPLFGIGGMNHFMLPVSSRDDRERHSGLSMAARYGNHAMELLINAILKHGGSRDRLEVKIFGGGRILAQMLDIGQRNIAFVREYVRTEGLRLLAEDVGDCYPRKIQYFPATGKVRMKKLRAVQSNAIIDRETRYLGRLSKAMVGTVELFKATVEQEHAKNSCTDC
jgi:chemotaxis protein CheD